MTRHREIEMAERAWDYPIRGKIIATCGHDVTHSGYELIDHWDLGEFGCPVLSSGCFCPWCAVDIKVSGCHIETWLKEAA